MFLDKGSTEAESGHLGSRNSKTQPSTYNSCIHCLETCNGNIPEADGNSRFLSDGNVKVYIFHKYRFIQNECMSTESRSEKAMAPYSSTLAWKIPWTEEPGGLQSVGSLRVGHD